MNDQKLGGSGGSGHPYLPDCIDGVCMCYGYTVEMRRRDKAEKQKLLARMHQLETSMKLLRRYHGGDGSISRQEIFEALAHNTEEE